MTDGLIKLFSAVYLVFRNRVTSFKYGPNGDFADLCPNPGCFRISCDTTPPVAIQCGYPDRKITPTCTFQHTKQTGLSKFLLEMSSQCC